MTPEQFITELFGEGWDERQLPVFLSMAERMSEDAQRYHVVRDYAEKIKLRGDIRPREEYHDFDDVIDAKRFELLASPEEE